MKKVYICSPCRGDYENNIQRAKEFSRAAVERGCIPITPHIYLTQFMDDTVPAERELGLSIGRELVLMCDELWAFGLDCPTAGMAAEIELARERGIPVLNGFKAISEIPETEKQDEDPQDAGSVIIASGSGLSPVFAELMRRNSCAMRRVEDFCCHEGGGLTALIAGREVLCGSAGFMRLMGILVPQKLADKSAVFIAVSGVLSGIFKIEYTASPSVGKALAGCLKSRRAPIFAVRDFLVTPMLLHRRYRVPAESFDFPLFSVRYAVSATEPDENSTVCALLGREGLGGFMEVSSCGRRCYLAGMLGSALSAVSAIVNLALAFALFAFGGGLSAAWLIGLACLWLLPGLAASIIGSR